MNIAAMPWAVPARAAVEKNGKEKNTIRAEAVAR